RTSIKDGLGRHIGSCGPLNRSFLSKHSGEICIGNPIDQYEIGRPQMNYLSHFQHPMNIFSS
ncbi:hypothetical protein, partial [Shewanella algae]|uniref:hypothetical protein n=1 Tax=Shewanella algae TaxID=38313 RepID=UPI001C906238